jgi:CRISPR-associated endoribonuclease Cas6
LLDTSSTNQAPAKLYALHLKLRPTERGTLMPFTGEMAHAAWLDWIRAAAPDVADMLHDGNKRRLFTCSSLQFPLPALRMQQAERDNIHLPLDPETMGAIPAYMRLVANVSLKQRDRPVADGENDSG